MEHSLPWEEMQELLQELLIVMADFDVGAAHGILLRAVCEYRPSGDVIDDVWCRRANEQSSQSNVISLQPRRLAALREAGAVAE